MKKILLSVLILATGFFASAQDFVQVLYPTALVASYDHNFAVWGATPDMTVPANKVIAPVVIARDGTTDSLMCNATTMDLTGKIALLYRGECEFGLKAKNAWNAGAVGVIIANNVTGEVVSMGAGVSGDVVTVPVVAIKKEDGLILSGALHNGDSISVLLGNKNGYYAHDLGSVAGLTANVPAQVPEQLAANTTDFPIVFAAQVYNYGSAAATNVKVSATIMKNGTLFYTDTSNTVATMAAGDSSQFTFTDYTGALGAGDYQIIYDFLSDDVDDSPSDNHFVYPFRVNTDKKFSYAKYDADSSFTFNSGNYGPSTRQGEFVSCITYRSAKASTMAINGVYFNASMADDTTGGVNTHQPMTGEEIIVTVQKWGDVFTYGTDQPTFNDLTDITSGSYTYSTDLSNKFVRAQMDQQVVLEDNSKYLVCATTFNQQVYLGYDNETKYDFYSSINELYIPPIRDGATTWYASGFVGGPVPSLTLDMIDASEVATKDIQSTTSAKIYPNPATDVVNVAIDNFVGNATLTVTDLSGRTIVSNNVNIPSNGIVSFNSSNLKSGMYIIKMELANGNQIKSSLVIE